MVWFGSVEFGLVWLKEYLCLIIFGLIWLFWFCQILFAKFCSDFHKQKRKKNIKKNNRLKYRVAAQLKTRIGGDKDSRSICTLLVPERILRRKAVRFEMK